MLFVSQIGLLISSRSDKSHYYIVQIEKLFWRNGLSTIELPGKYLIGEEYVSRGANIFRGNCHMQVADCLSSVWSRRSGMSIKCGLSEVPIYHATHPVRERDVFAFKCTPPLISSSGGIKRSHVFFDVSLNPRHRRRNKAYRTAAFRASRATSGIILQSHQIFRIRCSLVFCPQTIDVNYAITMTVTSSEKCDTSRVWDP